MSHTLLAWKLTENNDHDCSDYYNIHVIQKENKELLENITSSYLKGDSIKEALRAVLKNLDKYLTIPPIVFENTLLVRIYY